MEVQVRNHKLLLGVALLLASVGALDAQTRPITGRVVDSTTSQAVGFGQVYVRGAAIGAQIKEDGTFTLLVPNGDVTLGVRSIGYKRNEILVPATQSTVRFSLERDYFLTSEAAKEYGLIDDIILTPAKAGEKEKSKDKDKDEEKVKEKVAAG